MSILERPKRIRRGGDDTPARSLAGYVWRMSGRHQFAVCALALVVAGLTAVPLELQRRLIDDAIGGRDRALLLWLGGAYLAVVLLSAAFKYALKLYQGWLSESAIRYTRDHLARLTRDTPPEEMGESEDGQAVSVIGQEVEKLGGFVGEGWSEPAVNGGMVVCLLGYMLVVQPMIAAVALAFLLPQVILAPILQRRINALVERRVTLLRELGDEVAAEVREEGASPAAQRDPTPDSGDPVAPMLQRLFGNRMRIYAWKFLLKGAVNLTNALAPVTVLVLGGLMALEGQTTVGVVVAFITGFERLADPMRRLIDYYRVAARTGVQHRMIARWMPPGRQ
ncbi:MAG: ABC transporter ATP-binding protein [Azospirillaceae bacterium]